MIPSRSSSAVRSLARRSFSHHLTARQLSHTAPLRKAPGHHPSTPTGSSSDLPWIIGAVGFTVPASWYLLTAGSSASKHSDPHAPRDTASTSPEPHVQKNVPEHHQELILPNETKREADELPQTLKEGDGAKELREAGDQVAAAAEETTASLSDKAGDVMKSATENTKEATEMAKETAGSAMEKASGAIEGAMKGEEDQKYPQEKTSKNPQKFDPGDTATKDAHSFSTTSGKQQQGISNDDIWHAVPDEPRGDAKPRGDAIPKKPEEVHDSAKPKGTVEVSRPAK